MSTKIEDLESIAESEESVEEKSIIIEKPEKPVESGDTFFNKTLDYFSFLKSSFVVFLLVSFLLHPSVFDTIKLIPGVNKIGLNFLLGLTVSLLLLFFESIL
jgi:hypothetical protein